MTKIAITLAVTSSMLLMIAWDKIQVLKVSIGSLMVELKTEKTNSEKMKQLYKMEAEANQINRDEIIRLNKELTDVKVDIEKSKSGTTVIGK